MLILRAIEVCSMNVRFYFGRLASSLSALSFTQSLDLYREGALDVV